MYFNISYLVDIHLVSQLYHDLQFLHLDVNWIVVFAEKHLDFVFQNLLVLLNNQVDVPQSNILHLRFRAQTSNDGRRHLPAAPSYDITVLHVSHHLEQHFDRAQHHRPVHVLQSRDHTFDDLLGISRILGHVLRERIQDEHLAPLSTLRQRGLKLVDRLLVDLEDRFARDFIDLLQRRDGIGDHHGIGIH